MSTTTLKPVKTPAREATINPITGRPATALHGILMLIGCCLPLLGSVLLAPVLPTMSVVFKNVPGQSFLVPLVLTTPALLIAIFAPFAGRIVDRIGRKRLLVGALIVYAIFGTAPLYLTSLYAILATRVGVGVAEAGVMTCCTALLSDYFVGNRRNRYMGLQTVVMALAATAFFVVGGALGAAGWRTPFWLYSVSLILAVLVAAIIWNPVPSHTPAAETVSEKLPPLSWRAMAVPCLISIVGGISFYAVIVELPYVLAAMGITATAIIGVATALASLATAIGAFVFKWVAKLGVTVLLPICFGLSAVGLLVIWIAPNVVVAIIGATVSSLGSGLMFPTLLIWSISGLEYAQRGRGTGRWTAAIWLGQFASPLVVAGAGALIGGLQPAIGAVGILCAIVAVAAGVLLRRRNQQTLVHSETPDLVHS